MNLVLNWLVTYEYLAMVGILTLCGVGLPLPEEVTLLSSGLLVGWHEADFWLASLCCATGILAGDSIIFGLGYAYGQRFLQCKPMHLLLPPSRQLQVSDFFASHGDKTLFLARFFPGVRIGVYAYAGSLRVPWSRFIALDGCGVLLSAPASIFVGRWAARTFADDRETAVASAQEMAHRVGHWVLLAIAVLFFLVLGLQRLLRARLRRRL
jgi:membrane protein DedA with SNARE-associated domain